MRTRLFHHGDQIVDFLKVMVPALVVGSAIFTAAVRALQADPMLQMRQLSPGDPSLAGLYGGVRPLPFLGRLLLLRAIVDVIFYCVHRVLHLRTVYSLLHRKHHEHRSPSLWTNYHFSIVDLLLEAFAPFTVGLIFMHAVCGLYTTQLELYGLLSYIMWFEVGSHCGKSVPTLTAIPPLAPLIRVLFGDIDDHNALFHHSHHVLVFCNYGITQWCDLLMGSAKYVKH